MLVRDFYGISSIEGDNVFWVIQSHHIDLERGSTVGVEYI